MRMRRVQNFRDDGFCTRSLAEAAADAGCVAEVVALYQAIFNAKGEGEWGEDWHSDGVRKKLFLDTASEAARSFITTWRVHGELAGFSVTFFERAADVLTMKDLPPDRQNSAVLAEAKDRLVEVAGQDVVMVQFREMGIRRERRGGIKPIAMLLTGSGVPAMREGAKYAFFWTSSRSRLYPIVRGIGLRPIYDFRDLTSNRLMIGRCGGILRRLLYPSPVLTAVIAARLAWLKVRLALNRAYSRESHEE